MAKGACSDMAAPGQSVPVGRIGRVKPMRPPWAEAPGFAIQALKVGLIGVIVVIMLYPFIYVVAASFASAKGLASHTLIPTDFTLNAYQTIFSGRVVNRALVVSAGITVVGTALSVLLTSTTAYGLTRTKDVPGAKFSLYFILFSMLFTVGIIPQYLLVKHLGLLNSYWSLILPGMVSAFNLVVIRNFFMGIPNELLEAARIDGAGEIQIFLRVIVPLSKAVIAVIALFYAVGYWNDFFNALLYINDSTKWPIQLVLNQYVIQDTPLNQLQNNPNAAPPPPESVQMAIVVLSTAPILVIYPFAQRYFTKGVLTGAIKG